MFSAALVLSGCVSRPELRREEFRREWVVPTNVLQRWHEEKARLGTTFAGSAAWRTHMEFVERELRDRGVKYLKRDPVRYERWHTADDPAAQRWSLTVDGRDVPVASYWANSGSTPEAGVTAPLVHYVPPKAGERPPDIEGRIVVFDVARLPDPPPPIFRPPPAEFATADVGAPGIAADQWYQANFPTRFGKYDDILRKGKAAGGIVIFDMSPGRARGLYTFPLLSAEPIGAPGLYLDRIAGAPVREAARAGRNATLKLLAKSEPTDAWFLSGVLPGSNFGSPEDELVMLITHTDGPNLTQENGTLAILSVVDYFAKLPMIARRRSLLIVLDPQHYMPGRHLVDWYALHPDAARRIVASIGVEQFGQREYAERGDTFELTGRPETTLLFAQNNQRLVELAVEAVQAEKLPRTEVRVPGRGQGQWAGLGDVALKRAIPGYGTSTDMSAYWSTAPGIESFDADLAQKQIAVVARLTDALLEVELADIAVPDQARKH